MSPPPSSRLAHIDLLRAAAILYIVAVHHLDDYAGNIYYVRYNLLTHITLGLFVFLSGYLLTQHDPIDGKADVCRFYWHRFLRIYPPYALALILFMACSLISFQDVLLHMSLLNVLLDKSVMTLWFVSVVCAFYIVYPAIAYRYSPMKTLAIGVAIGTILALLKSRVGLLDDRVILYLPLFLQGALFAKHQVLLSRALVVGSSLSLAGLVLLYIEAPSDVFLALLMMSAIVPLLTLAKWASAIIPPVLYRNIAYASLGMYLLHRVVFDLATRIYHSPSNVQMVAYLTLVAVPVTYFASFYLQKGYDRVIDQQRARVHPWHIT